MHYSMKLTKKSVLPIIIGVIFLSSILVVVVTGGGLAKNQAVVIVDLGDGKIYKGKLPIHENQTALKLLSNFAYSVEIENGKIKCVINYCNTNNSVWKFYKVEETQLGQTEVEVNQSVDKYIVSPNEVLIFRYESR